MKKVIGIVMLLSVALSLQVLAESKYATGSTSATINFGARSSAIVAKSIVATSDLEGSDVDVWSRTIRATNPHDVDAAASSSATNISVVSSTGLAGSDVIIYQHSDGTILKTTVVSVTATVVYMAAGIAKAGTVNDRIFELTQDYQLEVGSDGTGAGTNDTITVSGDAVYISPSDSPVSMVVDGTSACMISATVQ